MIRVGIVGATGYGARELLRLVLAHPEAEPVAMVSESAAGQQVSDVLPAFRGLVELSLESFDAASLAQRCDVVIVGVPGTKSAPFVRDLHETGVRVLDLGPDFRLKDPALFRQYYKVDHPAPELLSDAVYGMAPFHREAIADARIVAVPGCYPLSVIVPVAPLLDAVETDIPVVVDAVSGVSGAGRSLSEGFHFPEMNEDLRAYKLAVHQHTPEIEQALGNRALVQFTPHVAPLTRGILTTITFRPRQPFDVASAFRRYESEPFVRVLGAGRPAEVRYVRGSNFCDLGWVWDERTGNLIVVSAIDNLMGGTSGMAVQCMNIMFGLDESTGLLAGGMAP